MFRNFTDVTRPPLPEEQGPSFSNKVYFCDFCPEGWTSETEVEIHRSHSHSTRIADMMKNLDRSICKMCMKEYTDDASMLRHIKREHLLSSETAIRVEREIFICAYCGELFFNKLLLIYHIFYSHMPKKNYKVKCPSCFKTIRLDTCWYHFLNHKLQSVAVCKICLTKHKDRETLSLHMSTHASNYRCDICGYATMKKELFDAHINRLHKKPELNVVAMNPNWMNYFMPRKHAKKWQRIHLMGWKGVKLTNNIFICILCREICLDVESMKRHILIDHMCEQTTKTVHQCLCGMVFTSKVLYKHHLFKFQSHKDI